MFLNRPFPNWMPQHISKSGKHDSCEAKVLACRRGCLPYLFMSYCSGLTSFWSPMAGASLPLWYLRAWSSAQMEQNCPYLEKTAYCTSVCISVLGLHSSNPLLFSPLIYPPRAWNYMFLGSVSHPPKDLRSRRERNGLHPVTF